MKEITTKRLFDPGLLVEIRKRIGKETFNQMNEILIKSATEKRGKQPFNKREKRKDGEHEL